jgi:hypothetical protein
MIQLGDQQGRERPSYALQFWTEGDPKRPIGPSQFDLDKVTSIKTSKSLEDVAGTWTITSKERLNKVRQGIREMDTVEIRLKGHTTPFTVVMKGVVDEVTAEGSADPESAEQNTVITGRCMGKYLLETNLFLPIWDPQSTQPTVLTFGVGAKQTNIEDQGVGVTPRAIFGHLLRTYTYGQRYNHKRKAWVSGMAGYSGIPSSVHWVNLNRFQNINYTVPWITFNEEPVSTALELFQITGFTETFIDEVGQIVFRAPGWELPVKYSVLTDQLVSWSLKNSDVELATYVEVLPTGLPGVGGGYQEAYKMGRAPVPSTVAHDLQSHGVHPSSEFIIQTNSDAEVTKEGRKNYWYQLQRRYGLRPQQLSSPLLGTAEQAQKQAEGLLRFYGRWQKTGNITIAGSPQVKLGSNLRMQGDIDGELIDRTYYITQVEHDYTDGSHYQTSLTLAYGRDPGDPGWGKITLPNATKHQLESEGGVLEKPGPKNSSFFTPTTGEAGEPSFPANVLSGHPALEAIIAKCTEITEHHYPYSWGGGHQKIGEPSYGTEHESGGPIVLGFDCSGSCSAALNAGGFLSTPETSEGLESFGEPGEGKYLTICANRDHVYLVFGGPGSSVSFSTSESNPRGGAGWNTRGVESSFTTRHPPGL